MLLGFSFMVIFISSTFMDTQNEEVLSEEITPSNTPTPTPKFTNFSTYEKPILPKLPVYNIYLIGDSMTHAFGSRGGVFSELINKNKSDTFFEVSNYAQANQSILLLPDRLKESVETEPGLTFKPILEGEPHLIIIESFGYNPLSQFGKEEGLKKQEEVLDNVMEILINKFPNTVIMFMVAVAPDKTTYAMGINPASADERWAQAEERIEYLTNHIKYAREHNIPLINSYEESLDELGDGDTTYINPDDNIHPSAEGLAMMGRVMVRQIQEEEIFPE